MRSHQGLCDVFAGKQRGLCNARPGASCSKKAELQAGLAGTSLTGTVSFTQGPIEYAERFRGTVTGSVSSSAMTLQISRLCDTAEDAGCVEGGTLVLNKSS